MHEQYKQKDPVIRTLVDNKEKAEIMAHTGNEYRSKAAGKRSLLATHKEMFKDTSFKDDIDAQSIESRAIADAEKYDAQANDIEDVAAYEYERKNINKTYESYINALPVMLEALDIKPESPIYNQLVNKIEQNIILGKYSQKEVDSYKMNNEFHNLPDHLMPGARLNISKSKENEDDFNVKYEVEREKSPTHGEYYLKLNDRNIGVEEGKNDINPIFVGDYVYIKGDSERYIAGKDITKEGIGRIAGIESGSGDTTKYTIAMITSGEIGSVKRKRIEKYASTLDELSELIGSNDEQYYNILKIKAEYNQVNYSNYLDK